MAEATMTPPAAPAPDKGKGKGKKDKAAAGEKKGGKKKLIVILLVVVLAAGAFYFLKMRGGSAAPEAPKPGAVVKLDPIYINLTEGHYLKLALALQGTTKAGKELDGSKALDAAINLFSGKSMADLDAKERNTLKAELVKDLEESYEGEVMDVYFTEFVMQ